MINKHPTPTSVASQQHSSLQGVQYVIFPYDPRIRRWDSFFLVVLSYYCFSVPYMIGVSGGYHMYKNPWWFGVNVVFNTVFFVDTIMQFFRAYRDENDSLVYNIRKISWNYFTTSFAFNLLASFPSAVLVWATQSPNGSDPDDLYERPGLQLFAIIDMFKLFRLVRFKSLAKSSGVIETWWERQGVAKIMLIKFIFGMLIISHWIACFWSFLAFCQAKTFGPGLGKQANWISNWYNNNYVAGGINPIGWENDIDRYGLSLFWAIQSLTSIGYGNVSPVTTAEYYFGNILMLISGIFWAFVIGHLVSVVEFINKHHSQYKMRMEEANDMLSTFCPPSISDGEFGIGDSRIVSQRIRRYITSQYEKSRPARNNYSNSVTLDDAYPILRNLSLDLKKLSSLHLIRHYLEKVPYLSSKYLSPEEQSRIAFQSKMFEFSKGEAFDKHPEHGRGIIFVTKGYCISMKSTTTLCKSNGFNNDDEPLNGNDVLVEDDFVAGATNRLHFISFAQCVFIPRGIIVEILVGNRAAWKDCARWKYLQECLLRHSICRRGVPPDKLA